MRNLCWLCFVLVGCDAPSSEHVTLSNMMHDVTVSIGVPAVMEVTLASAQVAADGSGIGQNVTASSGGLEVTGESSEWDLKKGTVRFSGDVVAVRRDVVLRTEQLLLTYSGEKITTAVTTGGVVLTRDDLTVSGETATLTVSSGEIIVTGNPLVTQGASRLEGNRVTVFLDDDRIVCEKCRVQVQEAALSPIGKADILGDKEPIDE